MLLLVRLDVTGKHPGDLVLRLVRDCLGQAHGLALMRQVVDSRQEWTESTVVQLLALLYGLDQQKRTLRELQVGVCLSVLNSKPALRLEPPDLAMVSLCTHVLTARSSVWCDVVCARPRDWSQHSVSISEVRRTGNVVCEQIQEAGLYQSGQ